jgi:transcription initiation factor TFIIIB Brf1 subunit/transcription initiation factor TFIIB
MLSEYVDIYGDDDTYQAFKDILGGMTPISTVQCDHTFTEESDGFGVCINCGLKQEILSHEAEWRYYGSSDSRSKKDPARCHRSKSTEKNIDDVFTHHNVDVNEAIRNATNVRYIKVMDYQRKKRKEETGEDKPKVVRGDARTAIVAACLWSEYKSRGDTRTKDDIRLLFSLDRKKMSKGYSTYLEANAEDRTNYVQTGDLIRRILVKTGISLEYYEEILKIEQHLKNTSKLFNHSNPQSSAASIVYLWLTTKPDYQQKLGLNKVLFAKRAGLSDITITKLVTEASKIVKEVVQKDIK